jgi:hypothetical protein
MKELYVEKATLSRFELSLGPENRLFYLEVIELFDEIRFYLFDYFMSPVTDFDLISEARQKFAEFNAKNG